MKNVFINIIRKLKSLSPKVKIIIAITIIAVIVLTLALTIAIINDMQKAKICSL